MKKQFVENTPYLNIREFDFRQDTVAFSIDGQNLPIERQLYSLGTRLWFLCPICEKRRVKLYLLNKKWACRVCHGLVYASQWRSKQQRLQIECDALREEIENGKPKWQHYRTHWRKQSRFLALQHVLLTASVQRLSRNRQRYLKAINEQAIQAIEFAQIDQLLSKGGA